MDYLKMNLAQSILALVVMASFPCAVMAQRGYTALTAEYLTANSDLIVRATISDLKIENYVPKNSDEELSSRNFKTVTVTLEVTRCLKETTDDILKFQIHQTVGDERLAKWQESKTELFWFFNFTEVDENGIRSIVPHDDWELWKTAVEPPDLDSVRPPIRLLNVDLQPLSTEKMVNDTIVQYVERFGRMRNEGTRISVSPEIAGRSGMVQSVNWVLLPSNYKDLQSK